MRLIFCYFLFYATALFGDAFDDLVTAYEKYGGDKYMICEEIIQTSHVLQAAYIANEAGAPENIVIGLLFHDIGQVAIKENVGNIEVLHRYHDDIGEEWLEERGFPEKVCKLVKFHTLAKVVLCMEDEEYFEHLSLASKESYYYQRDKYLNEPGQLSLDRFNALPYREDILTSRKCDDMAKIAGMDPDHFIAYKEMIERVIRGKGKPAQNPEWRETVNALHREMCRDRSSFEEMMKNRIKSPRNLPHL
ncbi:MAG: hypothetical protein K940chlam3_00532 [Chlamydiae bacterium]|nr:hypothetical protein [Chlamydiota bacterium]